ncbi:MAG TPA: hypothetical protein DDY70_02835 [Clostridiales bacterium]|nr:hypothetical protein [Clostridiales bacterium]
MTRAQKHLVFVYLLFLLGLRLSGSVSSPLSWFFYVLSYLLPAGILIAVSGREGISLTACPPKIKARPLFLSLPLFSPTVLLLFGISALTTLLLGAFGLSGETVLTGDFVGILFSYILLPALFEEFLFRYLPLSLLAPYGKRSAILFSALCFSLTHCDFFQMPYAFVAGILFAAIDLACGSVIPSLLFHLANNALSVLLLTYGGTGNFTLFFFLFLAALSLLSLLFIMWKRKDYRALFFSENSEKEQLIFTKAIVSLIIVCAFFAVMRLIPQGG